MLAEEKISMSTHESWYAKLAALAAQYGEDVIRAAEQHLAARFTDRPREEQLATIEHLAALRVALGGWDAVERIGRSIASGRSPSAGTEPQRAALAVMPGTGQRGRRAAPILIEVMSPTAGYATLATRLSDAITLSTRGQHALDGAGIQRVYELVGRTMDELSRLDGITAEDLAAIIRFCDKFGLPLGAKLDPGVVARVRETIASAK